MRMQLVGTGDIKVQIGNSTHTWSFDGATVSLIGGEKVVNTDRFFEKELVSNAGALLAVALWSDVYARCTTCKYEIRLTRSVSYPRVIDNVYFDGVNIRCRCAIILSSSQNQLVVTLHKHYFRKVFMHHHYWVLHQLSSECGVVLVQDIIVAIMRLVFELYMIPSVKPATRKHFALM